MPLSSKSKKIKFYQLYGLSVLIFFLAILILSPILLDSQNDVDIEKLKKESMENRQKNEKPENTPYFSKNVICELNLKELQIIANYEKDTNEKNKEWIKINLEKLGTDKFKVIGKYTEAHKLELPKDSGIIYQLQKTSDPIKKVNKIGMQINQNKLENKIDLIEGKYYEVVGKLKINEPQTIAMKKNGEKVKKQLPAYLEIISIQEIPKPPTLHIPKYSFTPPYNPLDYEIKESI